MPDNIVFSSFETIVNACDKRNVPVFTSESGLVERGAVAAYGTDLYNWGFECGEQVSVFLKEKSTVNLKCELDLRDIALKARNAEYNPKRFAAVIMRIREPKTTALIFKSGKMVCTGAKSEEESRKAARLFAKTIQKIGYENVKFSDFTIQNIVGSCDLKFPIQIDTLYIDHAKFSQYEPEIFPGLIYRMFDPKVVLLIFASGKIVLTGAKKRSHIFDAYTKIVGTLQRFRTR